MVRAEQPKSIHPVDPLNSYQEPTFRGWILTGMAILIAITLLWLAYSAALNDPDLLRDMDGRQEIQGPLYQYGDPEPGDL